jgi:hypothetical protein
VSKTPCLAKANLLLMSTGKGRYQAGTSKGLAGKKRKKKAPKEKLGGTRESVTRISKVENLLFLTEPAITGNLRKPYRGPVTIELDSDGHGDDLPKSQKSQAVTSKKKGQPKEERTTFTRNRVREECTTADFGEDEEDGDEDEEDEEEDSSPESENESGGGGEDERDYENVEQDTADFEV